MKEALRIIQEEIDALDTDMRNKGKNDYGVWKKPHNEEIAILNKTYGRILGVYSKTAEGIRDNVVKAQAEAASRNLTISYAKRHRVSPDSYQIYARDYTSPSGFIRVGSVHSSDLARTILNEYKILITC